MVTVVVKHYLTSEGRRYFPSWIEEGKHVLDSFEGFRSIIQVEELQAGHTTCLLMTFDSMEELKTWSSSTAHDQLMDKLRPFMKRDQQSRIFVEKN